MIGGVTCSRRVRSGTTVALAALIAVALAGCKTAGLTDSTGSISASSNSRSEADWRREGTHTEHGRYGMDTWLGIYSVHAHDHAAQIRRARASLKK